MSSLEVVKVLKLGDIFEIRNGIIGVKRDIIFQLMEVFYFRSDEIIQNVFQINFYLTY
jgi:hypothetical protein